MKKHDMKLVPISKEHFDRMADLHLQNYPGDFLPSFGKRFLVALYEAMFAQKAAFGFAGVIEGELAGFCVFTADGPNLFPSTLKRGFWKLGWLAGLQLLRKPSILKMMVETFRYESRADVENVKAEGLLWAVDPKYLGTGLGEATFEECERELIRQGIKTYKFTSSRDKTAAHGFFKKKGHTFIRDFELYGKTWSLHIGTFTDEVPVGHSREKQEAGPDLPDDDGNRQSEGTG